MTFKTVPFVRAWSDDRATTIGAMIRSIGGEELDRQVERNGRLHAAARGGETASGTTRGSQPR